MSKHRYTIGQKVRIAPKLQIEDGRSKYKGRIATVYKHEHHTYPYILKMEGTSIHEEWYWCESDLLPVYELPDELFTIDFS